MRETFPEKNAGEPLSAEHINKLSSVASRFGSISGSSGTNIRHGESVVSISSPPIWNQHIVEVSNKKINGADTEDSGLFLVKFRWYSFDDAEWKTDDKEFELDATELTTKLELEDKLVAFWDQQRGMFVPVEQDQGKYFELSDPLEPGGTAPAFPRNWNGTEYVTDTDTDTFDVVDVLERFRGRGRDFTDPANELEGSIGLAISRNGQWEIEHLQPHALFIVCAADGAFTSSTEPVSIKDVIVIQPVDTALLMEDPTITVDNPHDYEGSDGARIVGMWNDVLEVFELLQVDC